MKYKVGDFVRIQSYDWYKKNNIHGTVICGLLHFNSMRTKYCGNVMTIAFADSKGHYRMKEDDGLFLWNDDMIIGLAEDTMKSPVELLAELWRKVDKEMRGKDEKTKRMLKNLEYVFPCPSGYEFRDENGNVINATKIVLEKKKKEYPKCCKVMNYCCDPVSVKTTHREELIRKFQFLLLYRDAYWKIAGEEMGLGKPWGPDWLDDDAIKYVISYRGCFTSRGGLNFHPYILAFPTEEMRDAFYENFEELIEECKELL